MRVRGAHDRDTRLDGEPHLLVAQVEAVGKSVRLERDACLEGDLDRAPEVECIGRTVVEDPPARMTQAAHRRMPHGLGHACRQLPLWQALPGMQ